MTILRSPKSLRPFPIVLVGLLLLWGSAPAGQQAGSTPTVSSDLAHHPEGPHTHRVIVQAPDAALGALRHGLAGLLLSLIHISEPTRPY